MMVAIFRLFYPAFRYDPSLDIDRYYWPLIGLLLVVSSGLLLVFPIDLMSATSGLVYGIYASLLRVIIFTLYGLRQMSDDEMDVGITNEDKRRAFGIWLVFWMAGITVFEMTSALLFGFVLITIFTASNLVQLLPKKGSDKNK